MNWIIRLLSICKIIQQLQKDTDTVISIEEMGEEILEYCIKAASGEIIPKAVQLNQDDFIPWKRGVSL